MNKWKLFWAVFVPSVFCLASLGVFDLPHRIAGRIEWKLCTKDPRAAWRYGTADMQQMAMYTLEKQIHKGMSYEQVVAMLGRGSYGWPRVYHIPGTGYDPTRFPPLDDFTVEFNVRDGGCAGIDVHFVSNTVRDVTHYD